MAAKKEEPIFKTAETDFKPEKLKSHHWTFFIVLLAVVAVASAAIWFYFNPGKDSPVIFPVHKAKVVDTPKLQTYTNTEYGFEMQLPPTVGIEANKNIILFQAPTNDAVWINAHSSLAPVFEIDVYTAKEYKDAQDSCDTKLKDVAESLSCLRLANILGQDSKNVFVYDDLTVSTQSPNAGVGKAQLISSFKLSESK